MFKRSLDEMSSFIPRNSNTELTESIVAPPTAFKEKRIIGSEPQNAQHVSIIGNDLTILGSDLKIISEGAIRVDGEIQGEIQGVDVNVGQDGKVIGSVVGKRVVIDGQVSGDIQAEDVTLRSHSRVNGDVHHQSLTIDLGAIFNGQSKRRDTAPEPKTQRVEEPKTQFSRGL